MHWVLPEWAPHRAVWLAWPYREEEWTDLAAARSEIAGLIRAIAETETVELLVHPEVEAPDLPVDLVRIAYGDSWVRDTAPIFARDEEGELLLRFRFNGWGEKYLMGGDEDLAARLLPSTRSKGFDFVLEGGAIEVDGEGTLLSTTTCICNPNREPPADPEAALREAFGVERVVLLEGALRNDHTDGHVDTLARFVAPGRVLCMRGEASDPNGAMLAMIEAQLCEAGFEVVTVPSPGAVVGVDGELLAASYCNYYLANEQVLVPTYGVDADVPAVEAIATCFPDRRVRGLPARWIVEGGGAFHCITQQRPAR